MWCQKCAEDVPGVVAGGDQPVSCPRCADPLSSGVGSGRQAAPSGSGSGEPAADWQWSDDLRAVERLTEVLRVDRGRSAAARQPAAPSTSNDRRTELPRQPEPTRDRQPGPRRGGWFAWIVIAIGLTAFVFGSVLLVWSFVTTRGELWKVGLPVALVGQAALLFGLILQLEILWQSSRATSTTLDQLDRELDELRHTTTLLTANHSASQSFHSHFSQAAHPQLLLADIRGQLDMLARRINR